MPMMCGQRALWNWLVTSLVAGCMACSGTKPIPLRDLERSPSRYAGRIVTVQGCYHNGPESSLLQPCKEPQRNEVVWIVSRGQLESTAKAVPGYSAGAVKYERPSAREEQLAQQLVLLPNGALAEVQLRGEFRSSTRPEYGTAPGYRHEFVVHRVLTVSPRKWP
jgi:hypothetical protein